MQLARYFSGHLRPVVKAKHDSQPLTPHRRIPLQLKVHPLAPVVGSEATQSATYHEIVL
jgi:hypothetical protein